VFFADQLRDARFVLLQQLLEAEHHLGTLGRRGVAPGRERSLGGVDRVLNGFAGGQRQLVDRLTGGRVEHINRATVLGHQFAIDQMRDNAHRKLLNLCTDAAGRLLFAGIYREISRACSALRQPRRTDDQVLRLAVEGWAELQGVAAEAHVEPGFPQGHAGFERTHDGIAVTAAIWIAPARP
jgi:hypothetical protein